MSLQEFFFFPYFLPKNTKRPYFLEKLQKYPTFRYTQFAVVNYPKIFSYHATFTCEVPWIFWSYYTSLLK